MDGRDQRAVVRRRHRPEQAIHPDVIARILVCPDIPEQVAEEVVVDAVRREVRHLDGHVVARVREAGIPIETPVPPGAPQSQIQTERFFLEDGLLRPSGFGGREDALRLQVSEIRIMHPTGGLPEARRARAGVLRAGVQQLTVGLEILAEIQRPGQVGRRLVETVLDGLRGRIAEVAATVLVGDIARGSVRLEVRGRRRARRAQRVHRPGQFAVRVGPDITRAIPVQIDAAGGGRILRVVPVPRVVTVGIHEIALRREDGFTVQVFQRVDQVPAFARLAAGPLEQAGIAAAACGRAAPDIQRVAFEIGFGDDVDHARHRIGTIDGGGATGHDLDAFHRRRRNTAQADGVGLAVVGHWIVGHPLAVEQDQLITRAQAAQVDELRIRREAALIELVLHTAGELAERGECFIDRREPFLLDVVRGDDGDRRGTFDVDPLDARAGDGDLVQVGGGWLVVGCPAVFLRQRRPME